MASGKDVNVLVYGASTATGCSSTGANANYELFGKNADENGNYKVTLRNKNGTGINAPTFFEQATNEIVKRFGNGNNVNYYNIACGGTGASWGKDNLLPRVEFMNKYYSKVITPDIIFLKFMGNDVKTSPESFRASNESMVENFKKLYPEALIVMVSGSQSI